jgi:hypothetical protein
MSWRLRQNPAQRHRVLVGAISPQQFSIVGTIVNHDFGEECHAEQWQWE